MGNCQGKKGANVATTASTDVNTPKQVVKSSPQPETQPATPEKETVAAALSVAKSASEDVSVPVPQAASKDGTVFTTGAGTVASTAETANAMPRSSTAKSAAVSYAPSADETAVTDSYSYVSPESNIQTMPTDFTEVERENSFLDKVDAFRDSCCGAGADGAASAARDNSTSEAVESSPSVSAAFSKAETEASSTVVPVVSADETEAAASTNETEAAASAVGFSKSSSMASSVVSSNDPNYKQKRKLTKKLREIEAIEAKDPEEITPDQQEKLAKKEEVLQSLAAL
jgi:hypothetical protein